MRPIVLPIAARPDVEVSVDCTWHCGQLGMWNQHDDGTWWARVQWAGAPGETMLGGLPASRARQLAPA